MSGFSRWGARKKPPPQNPPDEWAAVRFAKRLSLVGHNSDPALSSYPLGRLLAHDVIDEKQHDAGVRYHRVYAASIGRQGKLGLSGGPTGTIDPTKTDEVLEDKTKTARECRGALKRLGPQLPAYWVYVSAQP